MAAHQGSADGDALHVAAGEGRRALFQKVFDLQRPGDLPNLGIDADYASGGAQRKSDVLEGGEMRIESEKLEHEGDVAVAGFKRLNGFAVDEDFAGVISSSPAMARNVVVLPQPDGPSRTTNSLCRIVRLSFRMT